jgi:outer membrane biosynthesis protein TonB
MSQSRAKRGRSDEDGTRLWWAIGASVGLHVLLILLSLIVPTGGFHAQVEPPSPPLRFTFAENAPDDPVDGELKGDTPLATEPQPEADLSPVQPAGLPEMPLRPSPQQEALPQQEQPEEVNVELPAPETEPVEMPEPVEEQQEPQPEPEPQEAEPLPDPERDPTEATAAEAIGTELPEDADADLRRAPPEEQQQEAQREQEGTMDTRSALADFRRAVEQGRPPASPSAPGKGSQGTVFMPEPSAMPAPGSPMGLLEFESGDYDWSDYYRQIYFAILRAWYHRIYAGDAEFNKWAWQAGTWLVNDRTKIKFVIQRSGQVTGIEVEVPSGCSPLDISATEALAEVILPRLPDDFPRDSETVHATFLMQMNVRHIRPWYQQLRSLGFL